MKRIKWGKTPSYTTGCFFFLRWIFRQKENLPLKLFLVAPGAMAQRLGLRNRLEFPQFKNNSFFGETYWGGIRFFLAEELSSRPKETGETSNHDQICGPKSMVLQKDSGKWKSKDSRDELEGWKYLQQLRAWSLGARFLRNPANISTFYIGIIKIASFKNWMSWVMFLCR